MVRDRLCKHKVQTQSSKASDFSFNRKGGRCETCLGLGSTSSCRTITWPKSNAQIAQVNVSQTVRCKQRIEITISLKFQVTVDAALKIFEHQPILYRQCMALQMVGLGYLTLGQTSPTLSGGEHRRIQLAQVLAPCLKPDYIREPLIVLMDDPTAALHASDAIKLQRCLLNFRQKGITMVFTSNNPQLLDIDFITTFHENTSQQIFLGALIYCMLLTFLPSVWYLPNLSNPNKGHHCCLWWRYLYIGQRGQDSPSRSQHSGVAPCRSIWNRSPRCGCGFDTQSEGNLDVWWCWKRWLWPTHRFCKDWKGWCCYLSIGKWARSCIFHSSRKPRHPKLLAAQTQAQTKSIGIWSIPRYQSDLHMTSFHANAPGDDSRNVNGEYIRVTNTSSTLNLKTTTSKISKGNMGVPRHGNPGWKYRKVHSGRGYHQRNPEKQLEIYLGSMRPIWDNEKDRATIYNTENKIQDQRKHEPKTKPKN